MTTRGSADSASGDARAAAAVTSGTEGGAPPSGAVVAQGAVLMLLFKLIERGIGFFSVLILARLLTPADFGLVAMATSVVALIELMSAFGFDTALIQRADAHRTHFDTAWTFQVVFGLASAALLVALAVPASHFYRDERVAQMLPVMAIGAVLQGFENIGPVLFRKSLDFKREFMFLLVKRLLSFAVTISFALVFRNFWALIAGTVSGRLATTVISYAMHDYRPRFSLAATGELFNFTKWLFVSNLLLFIQQNSDKFILGRTIGPRSLGHYNIASELATLPTTVLIAPINRAAFPAYSKLASDNGALNRQFLSIYGQIAMLAFPTTLAIAVCSAPIVQVLLGPNWLEAIPLLQLFVVSGLTSALQGNLFSVIVAMGHPRANTLMTAGTLVVYLPAIAWASLQHGAVGAAWVHLVMSIVILIPLHAVFFKLTGLEATRYVSRLWRPALASSVMGGVMYLTLATPWMASLPRVVALLGTCLVGGLVFCTVVYLSWRMAGRPIDSAEAAILDRLRAVAVRNV